MLSVRGKSESFDPAFSKIGAVKDAAPFSHPTGREILFTHFFLAGFSLRFCCKRKSVAELFVKRTLAQTSRMHMGKLLKKFSHTLSKLFGRAFCCQYASSLKVLIRLSTKLARSRARSTFRIPQNAKSFLRAFFSPAFSLRFCCKRKSVAELFVQRTLAQTSRMHMGKLLKKFFHALSKLSGRAFLLSVSVMSESFDSTFSKVGEIIGQITCLPFIDGNCIKPSCSSKKLMLANRLKI